MPCLLAAPHAFQRLAKLGFPLVDCSGRLLSEVPEL